MSILVIPAFARHITIFPKTLSLGVRVKDPHTWSCFAVLCIRMLQVKQAVEQLDTTAVSPDNLKEAREPLCKLVGSRIVFIIRSEHEAERVSLSKNLSPRFYQASCCSIRSPVLRSITAGDTVGGLCSMTDLGSIKAVVLAEKV